MANFWFYSIIFATCLMFNGISGLPYSRGLEEELDDVSLSTSKRFLPQFFTELNKIEQERGPMDASLKMQILQKAYQMYFSQDATAADFAKLLTEAKDSYVTPTEAPPEPSTQANDPDERNLVAALQKEFINVERRFLSQLNKIEQERGPMDASLKMQILQKAYQMYFSQDASAADFAKLLTEAKDSYGTATEAPSEPSTQANDPDERNLVAALQKYILALRELDNPNY